MTRATAWMGKDRPSNTVRAAVVGLGYWGPNLVRNLYELEGVELAAGCDMNPKSLEAIGRRYPAVKLISNYEDLLADDSIDAIALATPVSTHHPLAMAALRAGKHVFIEKPFAASTQEAIELIEAADGRNPPVMPGHTFLYSPPVQKIKSLIDSGELGDIYFISTSRVNLGLHQSDVSVAWDLGPHDFSILLHWLGETPGTASALSRGCVIPSIADVAFITMGFPSGTVAHVELSWLAPSKLRRTTIVGSHKMVVYDDTSSEPVRVFDSGAVLPTPETFGEYKLTYRTGDIVSPRIEGAEPLYREMDDFRSAIVNGTTPASSRELGLEVVRIIEAVETSLDRNGAQVEVMSAEAPIS